MEKRNEIQLTDEQLSKLETLKKTHGMVHVLGVTKDDKLYIAFLKDPKRNDIEFYLSRIGTHPVTAREYLLEKCWIEGDSEIKTVDRLFYSTFTQLDSIMEIYESFLKKS